MNVQLLVDPYKELQRRMLLGINLERVYCAVNPFAPGDFAEKRVLKLVEWFSGRCRAIKS